MSDKRLYVLAGFDPVTEEKLNTFQNNLYARGFNGTQTKNIPPHITLGTESPEREVPFLRYLRDIADEAYDFDVTFDYLGIFSGGRVLFAAPVPTHDLLDLHLRIDCNDANWTPHATLLIDDPSVILQALPQTLAGFTPFTGRLDRLYLYEFFPARHIATLELGKKSRELVDRWLKTFAADLPEDILREHVLKSCNFLWHVFGWGKTDFLQGDAAREAFDNLDYTEAVYFESGYSVSDYPRVRFISTVPKSPASRYDTLDDVYVTAPDFSWTYVHTHETDCGPYFCRAK